MAIRLVCIKKDTNEVVNVIMVEPVAGISEDEIPKKVVLTQDDLQKLVIPDVVAMGVTKDMCNYVVSDVGSVGDLYINGRFFRMAGE